MRRKVIMTLPFHITYLLRSIKAIFVSVRFCLFPNFVGAPLKDVCDHKATWDSQADMSAARGERSEVKTHEVQKWTWAWPGANEHKNIRLWHVAKAEHVLVRNCARSKKDLHLLHLSRKNTRAQILHESLHVMEDVFNKAIKRSTIEQSRHNVESAAPTRCTKRALPV